MTSSVLPPQLQARLNALPQGLQAHIGRVREIARELAAVHNVDVPLADLTAAAHDVARHIPGPRLIEEAERLSLPVNDVERCVPILLHGPVGAGWLREEGAITDPAVLEGVHWHTSAHPDLAPIGQVVFIADKLDPHKLRAYPFQPQVREAAYRSLHDGVLVFLEGAMRMHLDHGDAIHPVSNDTRNTLLLASGC